MYVYIYTYIFFYETTAMCKDVEITTRVTQWSNACIYSKQTNTWLAAALHFRIMHNNVPRFQIL